MHHPNQLFKCPHCDKMFGESYVQWFRHLAIHTKLRPYQCARCSYCCEKKSNMDIHVKKQHKVEKVNRHIDMVTDTRMEREMETICKSEYKAIISGEPVLG